MDQQIYNRLEKVNKLLNELIHSHEWLEFIERLKDSSDVAEKSIDTATEAIDSVMGLCEVSISFKFLEKNRREKNEQ